MDFIERIGQATQRFITGDHGIHIDYGTEQFQHGELYLPAEKQEGQAKIPVVILVHGGFWRSAYGLSLMRKLAHNLTQNGIAAWNIEYRRVGNENGGWPNTLIDPALATDYLRVLAPRYNLDIDRVVTLGHSAGGHLALWLAARHRITTGELLTPDPLKITGAVSLAGCNDLVYVAHIGIGANAAATLLGGKPEVVPERYATASPAALLPLGVRQVLVHGTSDANVPFAVSQRYLEEARNAGDTVELIELPGGDHFVVIDPATEAWTLTMKEIRRLLAV